METVTAAADLKPIDMLLWCPKCGIQHIDRPEGEWTNPPHRSHLCANCGTIWRQADVPTNGAAQIQTHGQHDLDFSHPLSPQFVELPGAVTQEQIRRLQVAWEETLADPQVKASKVEPVYHDGPATATLRRIIQITGRSHRARPFTALSQIDTLAWEGLRGCGYTVIPSINAPVWLRRLCRAGMVTIYAEGIYFVTDSLPLWGKVLGLMIAMVTLYISEATRCE